MTCVGMSSIHLSKGTSSRQGGLLKKICGLFSWSLPRFFFASILAGHANSWKHACHHARCGCPSAHGTDAQRGQVRMMVNFELCAIVALFEVETGTTICLDMSNCVFLFNGYEGPISPLLFGSRFDMILHDRDYFLALFTNVSCFHKMLSLILCQFSRFDTP